MLVRTNPKEPCQPEGVHHPHRWYCADPECDPDGYCGYEPLDCCVCSQMWPCPDRQRREAEKAAATATAKGAVKR